MSDFLYSSSPGQTASLASSLRAIYHADAPRVRTYEGRWGSLVVTGNLYNGFQPLDTDRHVILVIGGPVLSFTRNTFLSANDPTAGTRAIYERYLSGKMKWDEDLSGPSVILLIDKDKDTLRCITDLLLFIPVYACRGKRALMLGTHEDALAACAGQTGALDKVSAGDFILHASITHPYTLYRGIHQLDPATVHDFERDQEKRERYWAPREVNPYGSLEEAALAAREGLQHYIRRVTEGMQGVAQFLSAGEDTRVIAALLPEPIKRHGYIFVDRYNREQAIAQRVADAYPLQLHTCIRAPDHYFTIMPEAISLVGSGQQYRHAHAAKLSRNCGLEQWPAVFGGHLADVFLKGYHARLRHTENCSFIRPATFMPGESRSLAIVHPTIKTGILESIHQRRMVHLRKVQAFRDESVHEWFVLWPASMLQSIGSLYSNRRLFRTYEPFMSNEVIKVSAAVPAPWKLRRRLYHIMARDLLRRTRHIPHADGWYPYYSWRQNLCVHAATIYWRRMKRLLGWERGNQGSWPDWDALMSGDEWKALVNQYAANAEMLSGVLTEKPGTLLTGSQLTETQKISLLQVLYMLHER